MLFIILLAFSFVFFCIAAIGRPPGWEARLMAAGLAFEVLAFMLHSGII